MAYNKIKKETERHISVIGLDAAEVREKMLSALTSEERKRHVTKGHFKTIEEARREKQLDGKTKSIFVEPFNQWETLVSWIKYGVERSSDKKVSHLAERENVVVWFHSKKKVFGIDVGYHPLQDKECHYMRAAFAVRDRQYFDYDSLKMVYEDEIYLKSIYPSQHGPEKNRRDDW